MQLLFDIFVQFLRGLIICLTWTYKPEQLPKLCRVTCPVIVLATQSVLSIQRRAIA